MEIDVIGYVQYYYKQSPPSNKIRIFDYMNSVEETMEHLADLNQLYLSYRKTRLSAPWKESTQRYSMNFLKNIVRARDELLAGTYEQKAFSEFTLRERGKVRHVRSIGMYDKVIQRDLCDGFLVPLLKPYLTYDNGASMKNKGVSFARKRLKVHLQRFYREYGNDGYILCIDFSKFFDNIPHGQLLDALHKHISDERIYKLCAHLIDTFKLDVSYMSDEEYANVYDTPFNTVTHFQKYLDSPIRGEKFFYKSAGIGSQVSQISGVYYPTPLDNYVKIVCGCKYYGRYMDDVYIIHHSKSFLKQLAKDLSVKARTLGMFINPKKTQIIPLKHRFCFMQTLYCMNINGKISSVFKKKRFQKERRRLRAYKRLLLQEKLNLVDIENAYKSWRGAYEKEVSKSILRRFDRLYKELFLQ